MHTPGQSRRLHPSAVRGRVCTASHMACVRRRTDGLALPSHHAAWAEEPWLPSNPAGACSRCGWPTAAHGCSRSIPAFLCGSVTCCWAMWTSPDSVSSPTQAGSAARTGKPAHSAMTQRWAWSTSCRRRWAVPLAAEGKKMSTEAYFHEASSTVRFWVQLVQGPIGAMVRRETLHYRYHAPVGNADPLATYRDNAQEIAAPVRRRAAAGSAEP